MSKNLDNKLATLESKIKAYNKTIFVENVKQETVTSAMDDVTKALSDYRSIRKAEVYAGLAKKEFPMIEAAKMYDFTSYKVVVDKESGELSLAEVSIVLDPEELDKKCGANGGAFDKNWIYRAEEINKRFVLRKCEELGIDPTRVDDSFAMRRMVKTKDLGKNPTSNNAITKALQEVIVAMIGEEYKATSHELRLLENKYVTKLTVDKKAGKISVHCSKHKELRRLLFMICGKLVNGWEYDVTYELVKTK